MVSCLGFSFNLKEHEIYEMVTLGPFDGGCSIYIYI